MSTDHVPDPTAPEPASRIGSILASAERQVTEILAEADRQAARVHEESARLLQARATELEEIAAGLAAAASTAQEHLERLRALQPVELPHPGGGTAGGASAVPTPDDPPPAAAAGPDEGSPDGAATDGRSTGASGGPAADGPTGGPARDHATDAGPSPVDAPDADGVPADGAGILHRPAEWVGFGEPAGRPEPAASQAEPRGADATPAHEGPSVDAAGGDAGDDDLADMPIIAESDGAPYPQDPPEKIDSARLVALSMAANGRSREEVEAHVRDELGIVDHAALIDYVFGISAPSSIVPSWPPRRRRRGA